MDRSKPSEEQVLRAVEQSGFLLEHLAATTFENEGFHVETAWPFEDADSKKSREIDLRAIKPIHKAEDEAQVFIEFLVECKASSSPFVFLERPKNAREAGNLRLEQYVFAEKRYDVARERGQHHLMWPCDYFGIKDHYYACEKNKANHFTKVVRKGDKWVANHDGVYDALILPIAKATHQRIAQHRESLKRVRRGAVFLLFPCVVLDGAPLVVATAGEKRVQIRDRVSFVRNFDRGTFEGELLLDFVGVQDLSRHIECCETFGQEVLRRISAEY